MPPEPKDPPASNFEIQSHTLFRRSHLSPSTGEEAFLEFEFAMHHIMEAFSRWSSSLHELVSGEPLPVQDVSVLQVVRMNEKRKSAADIGRYLNRDDSSNILYTLRKLERSALIRKSKGPRRHTTYEVTDLGEEVTASYAEIRQSILLRNFPFPQEEIERITETLWSIAGIYEQSAKTVAVTVMLQGDIKNEPSADKV